MHKEALAERMLEMVTASQCAASIVGDLQEESLDQSTLWFWLSLLRIFISHLLQDLRIHWLRMIWLGFSGFLKFLILIIFLEILGSEKGLIPENVIGPITYAILPLMGLHLAKRSHGSELASGFSFICMAWVFMVLFNLSGMLYAKSAMFLLVMLRATPFLCLAIIGAFIYRYRLNVRRRNFLFS